MALAMKSPPSFVVTKLASLEALAAELRLAAEAPMRRANGARTQIGVLRQRAQSTLAGQGQAGDFCAPDRAHLDQLRAAVAPLEAEIAGLVIEAKQRSDIADDAEQVFMACRDWLHLLPAWTTLTPAKATILDTDDLKHLLYVTRLNIEANTEETKRISRATLKLTDIEAKITEFVSKQAASQEIVVHQRGKAPLEILFRRAMYQPTSQPDTLALLCRLIPEQVKTAILDSYDGGQDVENSLSLDERTLALAALADQLADLERTEEAVVSAMLDAGQKVSRRRFAAPQAILQVVATSARAKLAA
jgi:hypothetical protein